MTNMKCPNCGGTEFEKANHEGAFTLPYQYEDQYEDASKYLNIPKYNYACLSCGRVFGFIDLEARREVMKELIDYVLQIQLTKPDSNNIRKFLIEVVSVEEVSSLTNIPMNLLQELLKEVLQDHAGYNVVQIVDGVDRLVPVLREEEGRLLIYGERR